MGTLIGSVYGAMFSTFVLIGFEDASCLSGQQPCWTSNYAIRLCLCIVALPLQMGCGLFEGYEVATAALTSPIILVASAGKDQDVWSHRILGVLGGGGCV